MSFGLVWEITLGSWLTAALILLVRLIFGRWLGPRAKYALWLLFILRLLPLPLRSPTSLLRFTPEPLRAEAVAEYAAPELEKLLGLEVAEEFAAPSPAGESTPGLWPRLRGIWLTGAGTALVIYLLLYAIAAGRLRALPPCGDKDTLREYLRFKQLCHPGFNPRLVMGDSGMLGGFFRPVLVIPVELRGEGAAPIILHELMHYKVWDVWVGLLMRLLCAVYWFNPAVWFCFWLARRDGELACDRRVLDTGLIQPREYAMALMQEYQRCGVPDPMPTTRWGVRSMMRRISDILGYKKGSRREMILPILLGLLILFFGAVSPVKGRSFAGERSIKTLTGYPDAEAYVSALRKTPLGVFGLTHGELVEAGYLGEGEGTWSAYAPEKRVLTVTRTVAGEERTVRYIFRTTLYTEAGGVQVLTEIDVPYPEYDGDFDWKVRSMGKDLLEGWTVLGNCFAVYSGHYYQPLEAMELEGWEFLYWKGYPEDLEDILMAVVRGKKLGYTVRCTPVTVEDCLSSKELAALADLAVSKGWAEDRGEGIRLFRSWHLAGISARNHGRFNEEGNPSGSWTLNGMGIALYVTRPGDTE